MFGWRLIPDCPPVHAWMANGVGEGAEVEEWNNHHDLEQGQPWEGNLVEVRKGAWQRRAAGQVYVWEAEF